MTGEERQEKAAVAPDNIKSETPGAKFKIELMYGPSRTPSGPNISLIQWFESGKHFHGGGDDLMYWCVDCRILQTVGKRPEDVGEFIESVWDTAPSDRRYGCGKYIPSSQNLAGRALCLNCGMIMNSEHLTQFIPFHGSTTKLASFLVKIYRHLNESADIYCKYNREDIRYKIVEKRVGSEEARRLKGMHIYPWSNIIKDTLAGSSLESRFKAFLSA